MIMAIASVRVVYVFAVPSDLILPIQLLVYSRKPSLLRFIETVRNSFLGSPRRGN